MGKHEIIFLSERGIVITTERISLGTGVALPTDHIQRAWVESRRPGLIAGGGMLALGAIILARGAVFMKLMGVLLIAFGFVRMRGVEHVVRLQLTSGTVIDGLKTTDPRWAGLVLGAIEEARG